MHTIEKVKTISQHFYNNILYHIDNKTNIQGGGNLISHSWSTRIRKSILRINGNNNKIIFGEHINITGLRILIEGDNNSIIFGDNCIINASNEQPTIINAVGGTTIRIGTGCLLSNNIEIHTSDYHKIFNSKNSKRINPDKDIVIGDKVWIGLGTTILKGTFIADNTIIGAKSLCSGTYGEKNTILAGNPAKVIKKDIFWNH